MFEIFPICFYIFSTFLIFSILDFDFQILNPRSGICSQILRFPPDFQISKCFVGIFLEVFIFCIIFERDDPQYLSTFFLYYFVQILFAEIFHFYSSKKHDILKCSHGTYDTQLKKQI